jgi:hypothetical protein
VVVPVPSHAIVPEPDFDNKLPGKVPDPPVVDSCEHELSVTTAERLPLTIVQITSTFCGPGAVVPGASLDVDPD